MNTIEEESEKIEDNARRAMQEESLGCSLQKTLIAIINCLLRMGCSNQNCSPSNAVPFNLLLNQFFNVSDATIEF